MRLGYFVRILGYIAFLSSVFAFGRSDRSERFILTIDSVKSSVVPILCGRFDENGVFTVQLIDGTGFFVDENGHFVTAGHVIADLNMVTPKRPIPCVLAIYAPDDKWQRDAVNFQVHWFLFADCKLDTSLDLAVCKTVDKMPASIRPLSITDARPPDGSPVAFTGFPLGSIEPLSSRCNVATYRGATDREGSREVVLDKGTWPGASGSPIYDEDGSVIGIVLARGLADSVGTAFGKPSHFILKFLSANGVNVKAVTDKSKRKRKW